MPAKPTITKSIKAYCSDPATVKQTGCSIIFNDKLYKSEETLLGELIKTFTPSVANIILINLKKDNTVDGNIFRMLVRALTGGKTPTTTKSTTRKRTTKKATPSEETPVTLEAPTPTEEGTTTKKKTTRKKTTSTSGTTTRKRKSSKTTTSDE